MEDLQRRLAAAEAERDGWKAKAEALLQTPATSWPPRSIAVPAYPHYDLSRPKDSFLAMQSFVIEDLIKAEVQVGCEMKEPELTWVKNMLDYNLAGGKMNRGMIVVDTGVNLLKHTGTEVSNDAVCRFAVLGWCVELLQACLLVADDIMDESHTRRGRPCWYKQPHVGLIGINDAFVIESLTYKLLKRHFGSEPCFPQLIDLFNTTCFQTECGQLMDTLCANLSLTDFTIARWEQVVTYKTAFYSFYLPVAAAMIVTGITDRAAYDRTREILLIMGAYFQAQDDYLDCFGTPEEIGKVGTDIQDKKCSWLFVHAYNELANAEQKAYLDENYGKAVVGSEGEAGIKKLYADLGLPALYKTYEQESYDKVQALKGSAIDSVPWVVFETYLDKIYKRKK
ncbi:Farnesyl pyrophosphate synthase [Diplonema papillatum]|nr:Farnesyl pyrophosphate synthase [Diplonema papillatum]